MRSLLSLSSCLLIAGLAGCNPYSSAVKKHRARLESKLSQVAAVGKIVEELPLIATDDARIDLPPAARQWSGCTLAGHTALLYREDFADLTRPLTHASRMPGATHLNVCASLLRNGTCPHGVGYPHCSCDPKTIDLTFSLCESIEYLLVVRTIEHGAPGAVVEVKPDGGVAEQTADAAIPRDAGDRALRPDVRAGDRGLAGDRLRLARWTYQGGLMRAEVHVFELATARRLGGFRVRVESAPTLDTAYRSSSTGTETLHTRTVEDFDARCMKTLLEAMRARIPNGVGGR
jgi:hypothetical protein